MRAHRSLHRPLPTAAVATLAVAATALAPAAANAAGGCPAPPRSVQKQNAKAEKQVKKLLGDTSYTPLVRSFTPQPTSHKGFNGFETITVKSPKGTSPVVGYFSLKGGEACAVVVTAAQVVQSKSAYVVKLKFPGEQGTPGKLKVTLVSR